MVVSTAQASESSGIPVAACSADVPPGVGPGFGRSSISELPFNTSAPSLAR